MPESSTRVRDARGDTPTDTAGDVDEHGDVVDALIERLRARVGPLQHLAADVDEDAQLELAARLIAEAPAWP